MSNSTAQSLRQTEAQQRAAQLEVIDYLVELDLDAGETTFGFRTTIRFTNSGGPTFVDVKPVELRSATLNGSPLEVAAQDRGRSELPAQEGANELVVDALMRFRTDG